GETLASETLAQGAHRAVEAAAAEPDPQDRQHAENAQGHPAGDLHALVRGHGARTADVPARRTATGAYRRHVALRAAGNAISDLDRLAGGRSLEESNGVQHGRGRCPLPRPVRPPAIARVQASDQRTGTAEPGDHGAVDRA